MNNHKILKLIDSLVPYKKRAEKIKNIHLFNDGHQWYKYLINEWIPNQEDYPILMELFIDLGFDPAPFVYAITGRFAEWVERKLEGTDLKFFDE